MTKVLGSSLTPASSVEGALASSRRTARHSEGTHYCAPRSPCPKWTKYQETPPTINEPPAKWLDVATLLEDAHPLHTHTHTHTHTPCTASPSGTDFKLSRLWTTTQSWREHLYGQPSPPLHPTPSVCVAQRSGHGSHTVP